MDSGLPLEIWVRNNIPNSAGGYDKGSRKERTICRLVMSIVFNPHVQNDRFAFAGVPVLRGRKSREPEPRSEIPVGLIGGQQADDLMTSRLKTVSGVVYHSVRVVDLSSAAHAAPLACVSKKKKRDSQKTNDLKRWLSIMDIYFDVGLKQYLNSKTSTEMTDTQVAKILIANEDKLPVKPGTLTRIDHRDRLKVRLGLLKKEIIAASGGP